MDKTFLDTFQEKFYSYKASSSPVHGLKKKQQKNKKTQTKSATTQPQPAATVVL